MFLYVQKHTIPKIRTCIHEHKYTRTNSSNTYTRLPSIWLLCVHKRINFRGIKTKNLSVCLPRFCLRFLVILIFRHILISVGLRYHVSKYMFSSMLTSRLFVTCKDLYTHFGTIYYCKNNVMTVDIVTRHVYTGYK